MSARVIDGAESHVRDREERVGREVLGAFIDGFTWEGVIGRVMRWAQVREHRYVCVCNVHSVVTAQQDASFRNVINAADAATPDGMPIVWWLRRAGLADQARIDGPELMWRLCGEAERTGLRVFLLGGTEETLARLSARMREAFPALQLVGVYSPPFSPEAVLDPEAIDRIERAEAALVFVGLGCPKQERWMALHRPRLRAVQIGVGAAFDYHAGAITRAPTWARDRGLEWAFRLAAEPRRLWRRYLISNGLFAYHVLRELWHGEAPQ